MMKALLENWKKYTHAILNEDLLLESYQQTQETIVARGSKFIKGYIYQNDKELYDRIEEKTKIILDEEPTKQALEKLKNEDYVLHWDIGGYLLLYIFNEYVIPEDITEKQRQIALLWSYKQFVSGKILDPSGMEEFIFSIAALLIAKVKYAKYIPDLITVHEGGEERAGEYGGDEILKSFRRYFLPRTMVTLQGYRTEEVSTTRKNLIERFFQWNRFIRDGKKDLNSVANFDELFELVQEAKPLYQAWQEKQEQADADKGKELLLDDENWQVIVIHNKGAACQLGKGTDWCTAAPGLEYFKQYYRENDPLFYILDKTTNERFQFHFGSDQFMNQYDINVPRNIEIAIMKVLAPIVPQKYDIAYKYLEKYRK